MITYQDGIPVNSRQSRRNFVDAPNAVTIIRQTATYTASSHLGLADEVLLQKIWFIVHAVYGHDAY